VLRTVGPVSERFCALGLLGCSDPRTLAPRLPSAYCLIALILKSARVRDFKSINDSGEVDLSGSVTCLVGKNESGKTAFLTALYLLNPLPTGHRETFEELYDFPRVRRSASKGKIPSVTPITAVFELEDDDVAEVEAHYGKGVLKSRLVTISKTYRNQRIWSLTVDEAKAVKHVAKQAGMTVASVSGIKTVAGLVEKLQAIQAPDEAQQQALTVASELDVQAGIRQVLVARLPKFLYFDEYQALPGQVSLPFIRDTPEEALEPAERTALSLLRLANVEPQKFEGDFEAAIAELETASTALTQEVFEYWSQNTDLRVELRIDATTPAPQPGHEPPHLNIRINNLRHHVTLNFEVRSHGFQWFFSFLAAFSEFRHTDDDIVLLLDEPGLGLHASAQNDFLRYIDERLASERKVIYTTHSPFMVKPNEIDRVRTVEDRDSTGTVVSSEVLTSSQDTVFPLQAALGYELSQTLFVGPDNLLVEGPSDLLYLTIFSDHLRSLGREGLDDRWVIVPTGGLQNVPAFISLFGTQLDIAVVVDGAGKGLQRVENMVDRGLLERHKLLPVSDITGTKEADIEDLFETGFYLRLLEESGIASLTEDKLAAGNRLVVVPEHVVHPGLPGG
jgi:putative AbiEii toxin of type IV toxin-antitoxin system/AAA ATPase-like protein